jgi:hypothetical protein
MRCFCLIAAVVALGLGSSVARAANNSGEYLEARTCDVWTGPCFGNAQMGQAGKEAVMAWKVDEGSFSGVSLDGLGVALVVNADGTLGTNGVFPMNAENKRSVILVDEKANEQQRAALVDFVKDTAGELVGKLAAVETVPIELSNDHLEGKGVFKAGEIAKIETRKLAKGDCVCTNEIMFYLPLTEVENYHPAYVKTNSYQGEGLDNKWTAKYQRGAFLATFSR